MPDQQGDALAAPAVQATSLSSLPYKDRFVGAGNAVPAFTGSNSYPAEAFLVKCKAGFKAYGIVDPADQLVLGWQKVEGEASKFQLELEESGEILTTFEAFSARLRARFPQAPEDMPAHAIRHKTEQKGNNYSQYVQQFNKNVGKLPTGDEGLKTMLQEQFLTGMPIALRQATEQDQPVGDWPDLAALQATAAKQHQTQMLVGPIPSGSNSSGNSSKRGSGNQTVQTGPKRSRFNEGSAPSASRRWCTFCKKDTHYTSDCRSKKKAEAASGEHQSKNS